jgi:hypothetical protein
VQAIAACINEVEAGVNESKLSVGGFILVGAKRMKDIGGTTHAEYGRLNGWRLCHGVPPVLADTHHLVEVFRRAGKEDALKQLGGV